MCYCSAAPARVTQGYVLTAFVAAVRIAADRFSGRVMQSVRCVCVCLVIERQLFDL